MPFGVGGFCGAYDVKDLCLGTAISMTMEYCTDGEVSNPLTPGTSNPKTLNLEP